MFTDLTNALANAFAEMATKNIESMIRQAVASHDINLKQILGDAYKAASGAYQATVGIPYVGPVLAPVAAATAFAAVSAFGSSLPSARGGYDIPAGINPLTQLHQREMVLPAPIADAIRSSVGRTGGGSQPLNVTIPAMDGQSVRRLILRNSPQFASAFRKLGTRLT
jgi:hypothetical protein